MTTDVEKRYPALMVYITSRNLLTFKDLSADKEAAEAGEFADVAADLTRAFADYKAEQEALGRNGYPYNSAMGTFLGMPLRPSNEPAHGYYFANCVRSHYLLGEARREVERLIASGAALEVVTARSKTTGKPVRCARFAGPEQIKIVGNAIEASNGKRRARLSSNWSVESCLEKVAAAMSRGVAFGES